jgi:gas vesicle protein
LHNENGGFSGGHLAISFIVGAIAGVAVAMLTTPVSGREARQQLGHWARRGRRKISEAQEVLRDLSEARQGM